LIVGSPARLVRTLGEASARDLRDSAARYAANGRRFAKGLVAVG
jgi:carbonic anhydrase/acetyltransferase-like protein (isoleucine patch superfamily)